MSDKLNKSGVKELVRVVGRSGQPYWLDFGDVAAVVPDESNDHYTDVILYSGASISIDLTPDEVIKQTVITKH